jgi:hypothetical protein
MNITDKDTNLKIKSLKIAHIFVHLFEIGGGEAYLHNFCKYSNFENILFINSQYNSNTLFNFTNNNTINNNNNNNTNNNSNSNNSNNNTNNIDTILYNSYE